jgi:glyoxylase-like metal-dependent hydrolase (beta-lactamase superfamily II)
MRKVHVKTLVLGMVQTNCYIIRSPQSQEAVVIDPGDSVYIIEEYLKENDLDCKAILLTHGHFDHIMAASELNGLTNAPIYAHEAEAELLRDPGLNASVHMGKEISVTPGVLLRDKEVIEVAGLSWRVIYTPGHTEGGVCFYLQDYGMIFTGDTLFFESVGRTDLPSGNHQELIDSIHNQLMILTDSIEVYPGHGRPTTIGHERNKNPYL